MPSLPQRTSTSLIGTCWTRRRDGLPVTVVSVDEADPVARADTAVVLSSRLDSTRWTLTYAGLVRRYRDDQDDFDDELREIALGTHGQG